MALPVYHNTVTDAAGNLLTGPGVQVRVRNSLTTRMASLFSDRDGLVQAANPLPCPDGIVRFFTNDGFYHLYAEWEGQSILLDYVGISLSQGSPFSIANPRGLWDYDTEYSTGDLVSWQYMDGPVYLFLSMVDGNTMEEPDAYSPADTVAWMFAGEAVAGPSGVGDVFVLQFSIGSFPLDGEVVVGGVLTDAVIFPAGLALSKSVGDVATAETVVTIVHNGNDVGTITTGAGQTDGVFALASDIEGDAGDTLDLRFPDPADATYGNVRVALRGSR